MTVKKIKVCNVFIAIFLLNFASLYGQQNKNEECQPIFNPELMNFEGENSFSNSSMLFNSTNEYHAVLDTVQFHEGSQSLKITGNNFSSKTFATTSFEIPLKVETGTNLEVSAWIKTDSLMGENSGALIRLMGYSEKKTTSPALFEFNENIVKGNSVWTKVYIKSTLNTDLEQFSISALMQGHGAAWFDHITLKINGKKIDENKFLGFKEDKNQIVKEIAQYTEAFSPSNYSIIDKEFSNSRLIGLGEATHGTKEIFELKKNLTAYLVKNHNIRTIILEAYFQNTEVLNDHIQTGKGNAKEIIAHLEFWPYYTEEFLDLINWLKEYNNTHSQKVSITGIDAQSATQSLNYLKNKIISKDDSLLLKELGNDSLSLDKRLQLSNKLFASLQKSNEDERIKKNAEILSQSYYLNQYDGLQYSRVRDSLMALNTEYLVTNLPENEKAILWGHDLHIQKKEGWTGGFLADQFGEKYLNIGFLLGSGTFTALDKTSRKLNSQNSLKPIICSSLESILNKLQPPVQLLNMKTAGKNYILNQSLYSKNLYKRSIGALDATMQFQNLGEGSQDTFDYLIYLKSSESSVLLHRNND